MSVRLKKLRIAAGLTQAQLAGIVHVTQPTYQRWEKGSVALPAHKLAALAQALNTDPTTIIGRRSPINISVYDETVDDKFSYYGEVAIHFSGGGQPLLLSISEQSFSDLHLALQSDDNYIKIETFSNQTVIIRIDAVSDVYFSSEAYDTFGPEEARYESTGFMNADLHDWKIIEHLAHDCVGEEDFELAELARIRAMIMITHDQYTDLIATGRIQPEDLKGEREKNDKKTARIFSLATDLKYQLSNKTQRTVPVFDPEQLLEAFYPLIDYAKSYSDGCILRLEAEGRHRMIFINSKAIDYLSIPTHQLAEGREQADERDRD